MLIVYYICMLSGSVQISYSIGVVIVITGRTGPISRMFRLQYKTGN